MHDRKGNVLCSGISWPSFNFHVNLVVSEKASVIIEKSVKGPVLQNKTFTVNRSVKYAKLVEFNYVELRYYIVGQSL